LQPVQVFFIGQLHDLPYRLRNGGILKRLIPTQQRATAVRLQRDG
jgi:hypothetical protein